MRNSKTQYEVIANVLAHLEMKISIGASREEFERFMHARIMLLDVLADLLNNPSIAATWDRDQMNNQESFEGDNKLEKAVEDNNSNLNHLMGTTNNMKREMSFVLALVVFFYGVFALIWLFGIK